MNNKADTTRNNSRAQDSDISQESVICASGKVSLLCEQFAQTVRNLQHFENNVGYATILNTSICAVAQTGHICHLQSQPIVELESSTVTAPKLLPLELLTKSNFALYIAQFLDRWLLLQRVDPRRKPTLHYSACFFTRFRYLAQFEYVFRDKCFELYTLLSDYNDEKASANASCHKDLYKFIKDYAILETQCERCCNCCCSNHIYHPWSPCSFPY
jgi:hypothetical protein